MKWMHRLCLYAIPYGKMERCFPGIALAIACSLGASEIVQAETYRIRPPDMVLPADLEPGQLRRIIHPFPNWILICDENLKEMQRICNVSQTIIDEQGEMVFSWSLAASEDGKPAMIVRAPRIKGIKPGLELAFRKDEAPYPVEFDQCDDRLCLTYVPVGPRFRSAISEDRPIRVTIVRPEPLGRISFVAPLLGLNQALGAIE